MPAHDIAYSLFQASSPFLTEQKVRCSKPVRLKRANEQEVVDVADDGWTVVYLVSLTYFGCGLGSGIQVLSSPNLIVAPEGEFI